MIVRAAVLRASGLPAPYARSRPLAIEAVWLDPPGPGEVLIRVRAAGLCHSDLSVIDGNRPRPLPMALGHEAAGEVVQVGPVNDGDANGAGPMGARGEERAVRNGPASANEFVPGDHVVSSFVPSCGECKPCLSGRPALCEPALAANSAGTLLGGARRIRAKSGETIHHHLGVSAFAEYAVVSQRSLVKIDHDLPFDRAAVFGCAVITGVGAVMNTANVPRGASVAVIGLGGVGLAALIGARRLSYTSGALPIHGGAIERLESEAAAPFATRLAGHAATAPLIAIDLSDEKLATARALGATHTFNASHPDCAEQIRCATQGGVDFAFEMAGSTRAMELAYQITRRGGTTVTAGLPHPQAMMTIPQVTLVAEERTIKGSYLGSCVPKRDIPAYIAWHRAGELPVEQLLSESVQLDGINAAFDRLAAGKTIRQVVMF
jgi:alcohol dehydrogenase